MSRAGNTARSVPKHRAPLSVWLGRRRLQPHRFTHNGKNGLLRHRQRLGFLSISGFCSRYSTSPLQRIHQPTRSLAPPAALDDGRSLPSAPSARPRQCQDTQSVPSTGGSVASFSEKEGNYKKLKQADLRCMPLRMAGKRGEGKAGHGAGWFGWWRTGAAGCRWMDATLYLAAASRRRLRGRGWRSLNAEEMCIHGDSNGGYRAVESFPGPKGKKWNSRRTCSISKHPAGYTRCMVEGCASHWVHAKLAGTAAVKNSTAASGSGISTPKASKLK